jgi:hypothetical protein
MPFDPAALFALQGSFGDKPFGSTLAAALNDEILNLAATVAAEPSDSPNLPVHKATMDRLFAAPALDLRAALTHQDLSHFLGLARALHVYGLLPGTRATEWSHLRDNIAIRVPADPTATALQQVAARMTEQQANILDPFRTILQQVQTDTAANEARVSVVDYRRQVSEHGLNAKLDLAMLQLLSLIGDDDMTIGKLRAMVDQYYLGNDCNWKWKETNLYVNRNDRVTATAIFTFNPEGPSLANVPGQRRAFNACASHLSELERVANAHARGETLDVEGGGIPRPLGLPNTIHSVRDLLRALRSLQEDPDVEGGDGEFYVDIQNDGHGNLRFVMTPFVQALVELLKGQHTMRSYMRRIRAVLAELLARRGKGPRGGEYQFGPFYPQNHLPNAPGAGKRSRRNAALQALGVPADAGQWVFQPQQGGGQLQILQRPPQQQPQQQRNQNQQQHQQQQQPPAYNPNPAGGNAGGQQVFGGVFQA